MGDDHPAYDNSDNFNDLPSIDIDAYLQPQDEPQFDELWEQYELERQERERERREPQERQREGEEQVESEHRAVEECGVARVRSG